MRLTTETFARRRTPMPLPLLPELKKKEEERRRGAYAVPNAPGAAPVQVAVVQTTSSSPLLWLAQTLLRTTMRNGLPDGSLYVGGVVAMGLTLGLAWGKMVHESAAPATSSVFIPHAVPEGESARPIRTPEVPPSSLSMVTEPLATPAAPAAPMSDPVPAPEAPEVPAENPAVEVPSKVEERLQDAIASGKSRRGGAAAAMNWGGQRMERVAPMGGDFRPMRSADAVRGGKAPTARRNGRPSLRRISARQRLASSRLQTGSAQRAMGQLKLTSRLSAASAASPSADVAKQGAADAFEQARSVGGEGLKLDAAPTTGLSGGAPDVTEAGAPALPEGQNVTPYQDKVDSAKQKNKMTVVMLILGAALIAIGLLLVMMPEWELVNLGYALIGAGAALLLAGFLMSQQAKDDGKKVADDYGQKEQAAVIEDCAEQAMGKTDCAPKAVEQPGNTVHEAVEAESRAGYTLGAEGAQGGTK